MATDHSERTTSSSAARRVAHYYPERPVGEDVDGKPIPAHGLFDKRRHKCGCLTVFDTGAWRSLTLVRCEAHAKVMAHV